MKNQRDKLHQYQRRITILTDKETDIARQLLTKGDKKGALLALRRKKYQQSLLAKTDAQLEQLEKLTASVEFAQIQKDVVFGLQQGTKVLKEIHAEMGGIDHVEKLMGETADAIAYQKVWRPLTFGCCPGPNADPCWETGSQRDAGRPNLEPGRGRSGGRAGGVTGRGGRPRARTPIRPERAAARARARGRTTAGAAQGGRDAGHAGGMTVLCKIRPYFSFFLVSLVYGMDGAVGASEHSYNGVGVTLGVLERVRPRPSILQ